MAHAGRRTRDRRAAVIIRAGLPSVGGALARTAARLGAHTLVSAGSLYRDGWRSPGASAYHLRPALDSGGFTAMRAGGYRWSVAEYVEFVATNGGDGAQPIPWSWWAAMDYCCEPEIAPNRAEVQRRMAATVASYQETLEHLAWWRGEGDAETPDPVPVLQGRTVADYLWSADATAEVRALPTLVGVGSVCRRPVGEIVAIVDALDRALPGHVRLHLFGAKGAALPHLAAYDRVASVDSMAWDYRARRAAHDDGRANTVADRAVELERWLEVQHDRVADAERQLRLWSA